MTGNPEPKGSHGQVGSGSDREVIAEALRLLAELDDTPLTQMTPLFYQHGFEELVMTTRGLLRILGHDPDA